MNKKHIFINAILLAIFLIITICLAILMINSVGKKEAKFKKVLLIGIDAIDPKITKKLMSKGHLPNFKKLSEQGSFVLLNTSTPPETPVAWTTIATGVNPGKHNIFDFIKRDPNTYIPELSLTKSVGGISGIKYESNVKAESFWRLTSNANIQTTVIRWPVTFPPERIKGKMLSGLGVPDIKGFLSGYSFYSTESSNKSDKATNRIIHVNKSKGIINTEIYGPKVQQLKKKIEIRIPMTIDISQNSTTLYINSKSYALKQNKWSDWVRVEFKTGTFNKAHGTFKAYLRSTKPFELYITTIQIDPEHPIIDISYPSKYSSDLVQEIGLYYSLGMPEETDGYCDNMLSKTAFIEQVNEIEEDRANMFWKEFNEFKKRENAVFAFAFDSLDRLQHVLWNKTQVNNSVNKEIVDYYVKKDKFIGEVLNNLENETLLLIFSDHGFTSFNRAVSMNTWLVQNGFMKLTNEINEEGALFQYVDWENTQAYALGFSSIYINLKGREAQGIVEDKSKITGEIIDKLENLKDEKTGEKVVHKVYRKEDIYTGDYLKDAPDLIIGFKPGYRMAWETAIGGFGKEVIYDNEKKWGGDHLVDPVFVPGVLFSNQIIHKESASQIDIAPTILSALGISIPNNMDGKSILE